MTDVRALILAAGLGTRLRPLTADRAKPSLPVLGVPALWYGAWHLKRELGLESFAVNLSHAGESVRAACTDPELADPTGISFHLSDESMGILGSSGALWKLRPWIGKNTLAVCNGDSISFPAWSRMLEAHRKTGALLTIHARGFKGSEEPYTDLALDGASRVTGFRAKSTSGVMFAGNYLVESSVLARLPPGASELRPVLLEPLAAEGALYAHREDGPWLDTGGVASYARAQFELLAELPAARALVELKMREEKPGCWVPRAWKKCGLRLTAPVVLSGSQDAWLACSDSYGPRFVGVEPPAARTALPTRDAIVCSAQVQRL